MGPDPTGYEPAVIGDPAPARHMPLPEIDAALDAVRAALSEGRATWGHMRNALAAADAMRVQLYGSHRDDVDPMPVFVLRGRDEFAPATVAGYRDLCESAGLGEQAHEVFKALCEITEWQDRHPDLVRQPSHAHVPAADRESGGGPVVVLAPGESAPLPVRDDGRGFAPVVVMAGGGGAVGRPGGIRIGGGGVGPGVGPACEHCGARGGGGHGGGCPNAARAGGPASR